jgi:phosphoribosyl 1,2-cyclic phosphodiesterase
VRFACLGSGSKGNAWLVQAGRTRVLVDCGFGPREAARRLGRLGVGVEEVDAILVTHEHSDHGRGVAKLARQAACPVWLSHGSQAMLDATGEGPDRVEVILEHAPFALGDLEVTPYPVPHDAREPLQFLFSDGAVKFGLLTDAGHVTPHMETVLRQCDALALECNHDVAMLQAGTYAASLKRRILGRYGHLDNQAAAALLAKVKGARLKHVVAAHLSQENNRPHLARHALAGALGCTPDWIAVADQDDGLDWREI